jgi:ferredoxin
MKTIIYYFTGTGNSLAAAKKIAAIIGDCDLVPIASLQNTTGVIIPQADQIGIVCPVYFLGLPVIVAEFTERLDLSHSQYTFSVVTMGGAGGSSALRQLDGILTKQHGHGLDAAFMVQMPGNYILKYGSPAGTKRERILSAANEQLTLIGAVVKSATKTAMPYSIFAQLIHGLYYPRFTSGVHQDGRWFSVSDACTSCGTCRAICPVENIDLVDGRPVWKHHCELCCGCIHICPTGAIQAGKKTEGRVRYLNPDVKVADLKAQRGDRQ